MDCAGLDRLERGADVLVQCCYPVEEESTDHDAQLVSKYILDSPSQVWKIAERAEARKLVFTHIKKKPVETLRRVVEDIHRDYSGKSYWAETSWR